MTQTAFLASVTSAAEALTAAGNGADIIDGKDPARGALGALPAATVAAIRAAVPREIQVSATIGDLPADPMTLVAAARACAASGCDLVKIGFFPGGDTPAAIAALGAMDIAPARIVGLLLADLDPDFGLIAAMAAAGFAGVMLDTADKRGRLPEQMAPVALARFVTTAHQHGLFAGLAGSLRLSDVAGLLRLKPDVLGFRGALCVNADRTSVLSGDAVAAIRAEIGRQAGDPGGPDARVRRAAHARPAWRGHD